MELIKKPKVDWIGKRWTYFAISGALIGLSAISIATKGFNYAIDFVGGTAIQLAYEQPKDLGSVRNDLEKAGYPGATPQSFSGSNSFLIRVKGSTAMDANQIEEFLTKLQTVNPAAKFRVDRKEYVGPSVGRHLFRQAMIAITLALFAIVMYVAFRFENPLWGAAGVLALLHDVVATAGIFSVIGREVDLVIVASWLTIAGYSINDTIVIFDRLRERMRLFRRESAEELINNAINDCLSRTLITNGCVIAVVGGLFFFGGPVIHDFAFAMLFGGIIGTYSTIAVATPLVFEWTMKKNSNKPAVASTSNPGKGAAGSKAAATQRAPVDGSNA